MVNKNFPRMTQQSLMVLHILMENHRGELSGADIRRQTQLFSGTLYPILLRFEEAGLVSSRWEENDPRTLGRPRKRLYKITGDGVGLCIESFKNMGATPNGWSVP